MPRTPDRTAGAREEEALIFDDRTTDGNPTQPGEVRRVSGDLVAFVSGTVKSLTQGDDADSLFNDLNESYDLSYTINVRGVIDGVFAHAPGDPLVKIREFDQIAFDADGILTGLRLRQYAADGSTVLETQTYNGTGWVKS